MTPKRMMAAVSMGVIVLQSAHSSTTATWQMHDLTSSAKVIFRVVSADRTSLRPNLILGCSNLEIRCIMQVPATTGQIEPTCAITAGVALR